jgi:C-terminal processing protease CtpA/Prc
MMLRALAGLLCATAVATGCGGGGSSGAAAAPRPANPAPPPQPVGFDSGTFAPFRNFEQQCATPRTGLDPDGRPFPDVQGTFVDENDWLRSWTHDRYLWFDEIVDVDPASLPTADYFERMKTFETVPGGARKDQFSFSQSTDDFRSFQQSGVSAGYGAELILLRRTPPREVRVAFTQPGSPAALAGISRGAEIVRVDGVDVRSGGSQAEVDAINAGLFFLEPGDEHRIGVVDRGSAVEREVTLIAAEITSVPVQDVSIIDTATGPVGYLAFHDHIATAETGLADAITTLSDAGIVDLVVDLRYNGGGLLGIAAQFATMVAGPAAAAGRTFTELEFNSKHPIRDPFSGAVLSPDLFPTTRLGFSGDAGDALPTVALGRVFVLTGTGTCSASEVFMNALRGIGVEVVQIGEATCGKPFGFYPTDNCGTTYFSVNFRSVNASGWGDFVGGFLPGREAGPDGPPPGCIVADDFGHVLGDPQEARLAAALSWRETGDCPVTTAAAVAPGPVGLRVDKGRGDGPRIGPPPWRESAWILP